ncbi:alpha-glucosidase/alpha-galactosidase [Salinisphaera sp.]|uniref:alpha-glucosidase/alpha-galactosidase n=1 Tax=Salinisphaera sp. TaxID=1914330 RepID=UPI002D797E18|nr:alpha-glucosidase/alpha-galactosidase [Salinisphaera sp.]HET7314179.1 alpha-glucosidase/alpha-galactosidase [Salinisphaera sp.]
MSTSFKIAVIGGGSLGFTRKLFADIVSVPELQAIEFALTDIDAHNLARVRELLDQIVATNDLPTVVSATTDRRAALDGARYVINCARVGGLEAYRSDIEIPLKYGIDQCVGDTICAGGILYGQRNVPALLDFCHDIRDVAEPDALLLNYANPMAINTWVAIDHGQVKTVGLCHGVQNGWRQIADALGADSKDEVDIFCTGINHQTWYTDIRLRGRRIGRDELVEALERHPEYGPQEKVRIDVLKRFGYYSTESNGHLSEYLPWYRKRGDDINRWIDLSDWIHGETGGYLRYCTETRHWFDEAFPDFLERARTPLDPSRRTDEHASHILEALETGRVYRGHFNVKNHGVITNLASDAVVESPGFVDRFGINMVSNVTLPPACAATCTASINVQRLAVDAAISGDIEQLKLAVLHDPLVGALCTPDEVWTMVDEMVVAQAQWLPQYAGEIESARKRLTRTTVQTRDWAGAARQPTRGIEELKRVRGRQNEQPLGQGVE